MEKTSINKICSAFLMLCMLAVQCGFALPAAAAAACGASVGNISYDYTQNKTKFTVYADEAIAEEGVLPEKFSVNGKKAVSAYLANQTEITLSFDTVLYHDTVYTLNTSQEVVTVSGKILPDITINEYKKSITDKNDNYTKINAKSSGVRRTTLSGSTNTAEYEYNVFSCSGSSIRESVTYKTDGDLCSFSFYTYSFGNDAISGTAEIYYSPNGSEYQLLENNKIKIDYLTPEDRFPKDAYTYYTCRKLNTADNAFPVGTRYVQILFPYVKANSNAGFMVGDVSIESYKNASSLRFAKSGNVAANNCIELYAGSSLSGTEITENNFEINDAQIKSVQLSADGLKLMIFLNDSLLPNKDYVLTVSGIEAIDEAFRTLGFHTRLSKEMENYEWKSVNAGGGGMITCVVFHPTEKDLLYARTDVGGMYRRDFQNDKWIPLMDFIGIDEENCRAVNGVALDPSNPDIVYAACGGNWYANGCVYKSCDRGETWERTSLTPVFMADSGRVDGECIAVDPNNSDNVYCGSTYEGLFISRDAGTTWSKAQDIPVTTKPKSNEEYQTTNNYGIRSVYFGHGQNGEKTIFVGYYGFGIYKSTDDGETWQLMEGSPTRPKRMIEYMGDLYVTCYTDADNGFNDGMYVYDGSSWTSCAPDSGVAMNGITKTTSNGQNVLIAAGNTSSRVFYKIDNGSWQTILDGKNNLSHCSISDHMSWVSPNFTGDNGFIANVCGALAASPYSGANGEVELWLGDGWTIWCNRNALDSSAKFEAECENIEETVVNTVCAPPVGETELFTGIYDYCGFRHTDITKKPIMPQHVQINEQGKAVWAVSITSADYCGQNPKYMAFFSDLYTSETDTNAGSNGVVAVSEDYGKSWWNIHEGWTVSSDFYSGNVAVGADVLSGGYPAIVAIPKSDGNSIAVAKRSVDLGRSWQEVSGLPQNLLYGKFRKNLNIIAADRVNPNKFYVYDRYNGEFYYSEDAGVSFVKSNFKIERQSGSNASVNNDIEANPNVEGDVLFCAYNRGLFRTKDSGKSIIRMEGINDVEGVAFGANVPGTQTASIFVLATIDGVRGIYRSDDDGNSWIYTYNPQMGFGVCPQGIEGDKRVFGRVYVATAGRSVLYGEPLGDAVKTISFTDDAVSTDWIELDNIAKKSAGDATWKGWYAINGNSQEGSITFSFDGSKVKRIGNRYYRLSGIPQKLQFAVMTFNGKSASMIDISVSENGTDFTSIGNAGSYVKWGEESMYSVLDMNHGWTKPWPISISSEQWNENTKYIKLTFPADTTSSSGLIMPTVTYTAPTEGYEVASLAYTDENGEYITDIQAGTVNVSAVIDFNFDDNKEKADVCTVTALYEGDVLAEVSISESKEIKRLQSETFNTSVTIKNEADSKIITYVWDGVNSMKSLTYPVVFGE